MPCKHGGAGNVFINLEPARDRYLLTVRDDGRGFSTSNKTHTGMGIRIMEYRARVIGANFALHSAPGSGTHLTCLFFAVSRDKAGEVENPNPPQDSAVAYERTTA